ncbi:hypothetical protein SO802_010219 [Lithocarpus litseifolius]|uniref:Uncharacterized protein n=1 Tax=Lithocarpus litseifolius TaxID=425828 RepID=A0AAW2DFX0_9ROSI
MAKEMFRDMGSKIDEFSEYRDQVPNAEHTASVLLEMFPLLGAENITSSTRKRVVVHARHHADHEDDVLRHHDEHVGDVFRHEHVVDGLHHHDNALLLLHDDGPIRKDHDRRDAHCHHDNALLFCHVHVLRDVLLQDHDHVHFLHDVPHRGVEYGDDFRGETFSKVVLKSKLRILDGSLVRKLLRVHVYL